MFGIPDDELGQSVKAVVELIVDLSKVTYIDAARVDILVNAAARTGEADIPLCLACLHGAVKDTFAASSL